MTTKLSVTNEFNGVFYFTNATKKEFKHLWNNKEYIFPAQSTCPMLIPNSTGEEIQEIRKRFAYDLAMDQFYDSKEYKRLVQLGNKAAGGTPPIPDLKILQPWIDECLTPLPHAVAIVRDVEKPHVEFRVTKAVDETANLNLEFKDDPIITVGKLN